MSSKDTQLYFYSKVSGSKFLHLNSEFKKSADQTSERQQIYSLSQQAPSVEYVPGPVLAAEHAEMSKNSALVFSYFGELLLHTHFKTKDPPQSLKGLVEKHEFSQNVSTVLWSFFFFFLIMPKSFH